MTTLFFHTAFLASFFVCSLAGGIEPIWRFQSPLGGVDSTPAIADIDGGGQPKLVLTTTGGMVIVLDSQGKQMWMQGVQIPISLPPTVADMLEGPELEILVLNQTGSLYCLDGRTGNVVWRYDLPSGIEWGESAIAVADIDGDGDLEAIVGDRDGHVACISSEGELQWQYNGPHGSTYCPAVGPIGEDENPSILISGSKLPLLCLDATGKERWRVEKTGKGASPILADINGDGKNEIITGVGSAVMAVDGSGKPLWEHPMKKEMDSSLCVADANEDGVVEIYAIDLMGQFAAISPEGKTLWTADVHERVRRSPAIGDIDGDGAIEIIVAGYSRELYLFTSQGELQENQHLTATNASPVIADFNGDGTPSLVCATLSGAVTAYRWPEAKPDAKILWPQYRFGPSRAGIEAKRIRSSVQIQAIDFGKHYVGENVASVTVKNPSKRPLVVVIAVETGDKKTPSRRFGFGSSSKEMAFETKYSISDEVPSTVKIDCSVLDGEQVVAQRRNSAYVVPFKKEMADLQAVLARVKDSASAIPEAFDFLGQVAACEGRLPEYERQAAIAGTLDGMARRGLRDALRSELDHFGQLDKLTGVARAHHADGRWPLRLSEANPWAPFGRMEEVQEDRLRDANVNVEAFSGEVEGAALNVFNFGAQSLMARVEVEDFTLDGAADKAPALAHQVVRLHEVVNVPTQMSDVVADALPRMNQADVITLPSR